MDIQQCKTRSCCFSKCSSPTIRYLMQRWTAVMMLPLTLWFLIAASFVAKGVIHGDARTAIVVFLMDTKNAVLFSLFWLIGLKHGMLGIKVILEDYVSDACKRGVMIKAVCIFTLISAMLLVLSVIAIHCKAIL